MSTTTRERVQPGAQAPPPPARVPGNRWPEIDAPGLDELRPHLRCSVVVAGADDEAALAATLRVLSATSYPHELVEVIAAGAGSGTDDNFGSGPSDSSSPGDSPGASTATTAALPLRHAEDAAQAAAQADGELLVFLRAGSIPAPALLSAHARWHHAVADAVTVGHSPPLAAGGPSAAQIADAADRGELEARLGELPEAADEALETFLELTRGLTERRPDLFLVAARHNVALRAETYQRAGGLRPDLSDALAQLELAYRLEATGAVFVPEAEARSYGGLTPGDWPLPDDSGQAPAPSDPRAEALIPAPGFRPPRSGRAFERPALVVDLDVSDERAEEVLESVDSVLRGRFSDLRLRVSVPERHPEAEALVAALSYDPRVEAGPQVTAQEPDSPYRVWLPLVAVPDERTFADLHGLIEAEGVGALHVTVPGELPRNAMVEVVATGPAARARRLAELDGVEVAPLLGELFGERWISGVEVSLRRRGAAEPQVTEHGPLAPATDLAHERAEHLKQRARARKQEARADRHAQRAVRERLRARQEKARADRLEHRLETARGRPSYRLLSLARRARRAVARRRGG